MSHPFGLIEREEHTNSKTIKCLDYLKGTVEFEWMDDAKVSPLGSLVFFVQFLNSTGVYKSWIDECPLYYTSNNAPKKENVIGTAFLSVLSGHTRYAHATALRGDKVNPELLGMTKVVSEDSLRNGLLRIDEESGKYWQQKHLIKTLTPMLKVPWILDIDTTIKTVYGRQEGAEVSYNPHKPGRPSHSYHTYIMAKTRLVLDVDVQPGNQHTSKDTRPELWKLLHGLPKDLWPTLLRGDCGFGNEETMVWPEEKKLDYLFKVRKSKGIQSIISNYEHTNDWIDAGQGWEGLEESCQLSGWSKKRRILILRRLIEYRKKRLKKGQTLLPFEGNELINEPVYEYAVLVTSLSNSILEIAQLYRDRADAENVFDELKNQWGWAGYTTKDMKRCQFITRLIAQVYNWWSLFVRLADNDHHREAITSRPALLHSVAKVVKHSSKTIFQITHLHANAKNVKKFLEKLTNFLNGFSTTAEQLKQEERWDYIIRMIFRKIFGSMAPT